MRRRRTGAAPAEPRRATYFAFQGLFMTVLLLMFLYEARGVEGWTRHLGFLFLMMAGSLAALRIAPPAALATAWFQTAFFLGDAALASLILRWTQPNSDFYLLYFLIIFGTALTRDIAKSLVAALVTSLLFLASAWSPAVGVPKTTGFWLRFLMLWTSAPLLAILSRDTEQARVEQERKYQERLIQLERLGALGQLAGEVAHRIKGPLTTIMVNAEVLSHRYSKAPETRRELEEIREEVDRCKQILKHLLDLGRIEEMDSNPVDLREPLRHAIKALEPQLRARGAHALALAEPRAPMPVVGDASLLQEAFTAVLQNAVDATAGGGSIRVTARSGTQRRGWLRPKQPVWEVVVEDDGVGVAQADLERVFQPFFTTKGDQGNGLGLSAALRILQKHGGTIEAASDGRGRGARFALMFPPSTRGA